MVFSPFLSGFFFLPISRSVCLTVYLSICPSDSSLKTKRRICDEKFWRTPWTWPGTLDSFHAKRILARHLCTIETLSLPGYSCKCKNFAFGFV